MFNVFLASPGRIFKRKQLLEASRLYDDVCDRSQREGLGRTLVVAVEQDAMANGV